VRTKVGVFAVFSIIILMIVPVHAEVTEVSPEKSFFTVDEKISFLGSESEGSVLVNVIVKDPNGKSKLLGGFSDPKGEFKTIPQSVENIFSVIGTYNVTAFVYKIENGTSFLLEFDGDKVFDAPNVVLELKSIPDKTVEEAKTLSFTVTLTDTVEDVVYSLDKNPPAGATINPETGKFLWTPTESQGPEFYTFDIVVTKGSQTDKESIEITVTEKAQPVPQPVPQPEPTTEPEPKAEPNELEIASFVDKTKDPQSYVDRYNNEEVYKKWFDDNFSEYDSIYQAVGLKEPKRLAPFVDPNLDPQHYIDRYNNEITYKEWFDKTYPDITIYEAVGLEEPKIEESEFGECGEGTDLVDGMCVIVDNSQGGGCLIATATYGSEMAPQVQFLREIRDNQLMSTDSGVSFMTGFNQFYYSFSPIIADMERENPIFKEAVKIGITPLLSSLSIMSHAESESEILGYGIGVLLLNLGMYVAVPAMLIYKARKYVRI
jgi:hypothetical protein